MCGVLQEPWGHSEVGAWGGGWWRELRVRGPLYEASRESRLGMRSLSSSNVQAAGIVRQPSAGDA